MKSLVSHPVLDDFTDDSYNSVMQALKDTNMDCTWFSKELTLALIEFGKETAKKICIGRPKIGSVDYSDVEPEYMPNDDDYKNWREKFKKA